MQHVFKKHGLQLTHVDMLFCKIYKEQASKDMASSYIPGCTDVEKHSGYEALHRDSQR